MKKYFLSILLMSMLVYPLWGQNKHVSLFGHFDPEPIHYAGSWGWTDPMGAEYALIGAFNGTYFIPIDDSMNLYSADFLSGPSSNWREMTVVNNHGYIVTEGEGSGEGMQIVDLQTLPDSVHLVTTFDSTFSKSHIISKNIDGDNYVYVSGTNTSQGVHIIDISNPQKPVEVGVYSPGYYIHDCHVRGSRMYAAAFFESTMDIVDISDRTNPVKIASIADPNGNTHSSWTTKDHNYLFSTNELDGTIARVWDISDLSNIEPVATYTANILSLVHNPYIRDDFAFISHNTEGLRVVDLTEPSLPVEVGYYDTWTGASGGFNGLWSAFPFFPSGKIIGANRHDGLYIFRFDNTKGTHFQIQVLDSINPSLFVPNATVSIPLTMDTIYTDIYGVFRKGILLEGPTQLKVTISADGYETKDEFLYFDGENWLPFYLYLNPKSATDIEDFEKIEKPYSFLPKAKRNSFILNINDPNSKDYSWTLIDIQGKEIINNDHLSQNDNHLNFNYLAKGLYFFRIEKKDQLIESIKIILK